LHEAIFVNEISDDLNLQSVCLFLEKCLTAPQTLFPNGSAILELRIFFEKGPSNKNFFITKNPKKESKEGEEKICFWGLIYCSRKVLKNFMGVSILISPALRGLIKRINKSSTKTTCSFIFISKVQVSAETNME